MGCERIVVGSAARSARVNDHCAADDLARPPPTQPHVAERDCSRHTTTGGLPSGLAPPGAGVRRSPSGRQMPLAPDVLNGGGLVGSAFAPADQDHRHSGTGVPAAQRQAAPLTGRIGGFPHPAGLHRSLSMLTGDGPSGAIPTPNRLGRTGLLSISSAPQTISPAGRQRTPRPPGAGTALAISRLTQPLCSAARGSARPATHGWVTTIQHPSASALQCRSANLLRAGNDRRVTQTATATASRPRRSERAGGTTRTSDQWAPFAGHGPDPGFAGATSLDRNSGLANGRKPASRFDTPGAGCAAGWWLDRESPGCRWYGANQALGAGIPVHFTGRRPPPAAVPHRGGPFRGPDGPTRLRHRPGQHAERSSLQDPPSLVTERCGGQQPSTRWRTAGSVRIGSPPTAPWPISATKSWRGAVAVVRSSPVRVGCRRIRCGERPDRWTHPTTAGLRALPGPGPQESARPTIVGRAPGMPRVSGAQQISRVMPRVAGPSRFRLRPRTDLRVRRSDCGRPGSPTSTGGHRDAPRSAGTPDVRFDVSHRSVERPGPIVEHVATVESRRCGAVDAIAQTAERPSFAVLASGAADQGGGPARRSSRAMPSFTDLSILRPGQLAAAITTPPVLLSAGGVGAQPGDATPRQGHAGHCRAGSFWVAEPTTGGASASSSDWMASPATLPAAHRALSGHRSAILRVAAPAARAHVRPAVGGYPVRRFAIGASAPASDAARPHAARATDSGRASRPARAIDPASARVLPGLTTIFQLPGLTASPTLPRRPTPGRGRPPTAPSGRTGRHDRTRQQRGGSPPADALDAGPNGNDHDPADGRRDCRKKATRAWPNTRPGPIGTGRTGTGPTRDRAERDRADAEQGRAEQARRGTGPIRRRVIGTSNGPEPSELSSSDVPCRRLPADIAAGDLAETGHR